MKKTLSLILACVMLLCLCACGGSTGGSETGDSSGDEVYTVSIQLSFPEESADGAKAVMEAIEEESNGRIKFEVYYSYSFVDAGDIVDALETNQLNVAGFMPSDFSIFSLNGRVCALPLMNYPSWEAANKIWLEELYSTEEMLAEFTDNGMVFWAGYMCPGYQFYSSEEITSFDPSMFNGLTIMCDNAEMSAFISQNNGGAITVIPTDFLTNLQNGVAEALMQHVNCAYAFGCLEYVKSAVFFGEGGFYNLPLAYAFSETFWNSLPEDLQQIFAEHATDMCQKGYESDLALYENVAYPTLENAATITVLTDAQIAEWQDAISSVVQNAIVDIETDSPTASEVYDSFKDAIANYDADNFDMGTNNFGLDANWS